MFSASKTINIQRLTSFAAKPVGTFSRYKSCRSSVWNERNTSVPSSSRTFTSSTTVRNSARMAPPETKGFQFNHTMLRVKDPQVSIKFYTEIFGMELIDTHEGGDFTLYFLAFDHSDGKLTAQEKSATRTAREGILELTHNHGTESDASFQGYHNGNKEPKGFGHIAVSVDNIEEACARFERLGVRFQKKLTDGKMKHIAFVLDPDDYWVEIVPKHLNRGEA